MISTLTKMEENKSVIDTRTFQEIWKSLTPGQRGYLRYQLIHDTTCTRQTIQNWAKGVMPVHLRTRDIVARTVSKVLQINTRRNILFPDSKSVEIWNRS